MRFEADTVDSDINRFSNSVNIFYVVENSTSVKYRRCAVWWDGPPLPGQDSNADWISTSKRLPVNAITKGVQSAHACK